MAYALPTDILASWPKVHTSGLSHEELRTMIVRAGNRVDAELCHRYSVPFVTDPASSPPLIKDLVVDLAMMDVLYRSGDPPPFVLQRIQWAHDTLTRLAGGELCVLDASGGMVAETGTSNTISSNTSGYTPTFGVAPSLAEVVDPDRADDEDDARG